MISKRPHWWTLLAGLPAQWDLANVFRRLAHPLARTLRRTTRILGIMCVGTPAHHNMSQQMQQERGDMRDE